LLSTEAHPDDELSVAAFATLTDGFARACAARPAAVSDETFSVGGSTVNLRVVGSALATTLRRSLVLAIHDLGTSATALSARGPLRLDLWDEEATGVALEPRPPRPPDLERWGPAGERLGITPGGRYVRFGGPDFEIRMDRVQSRAVGWVRSEGRLASWHRARPLQSLFVAWVSSRGATVVHAAMVARAGTGVLLAGPALSGKSTASAACGGRGFDLLGDDTIALELHGEAVYGHTVHAAIKLRRAGLDRHGGLRSMARDCGPQWQDEAVVFVSEAFPGQAVASSRVAALAFPVLVSAPRTSFSAIPEREALRALTGCILSVEPGNVAEAFAAVAEVTSLVPAYRLCVGSATERVPDGLDELLAAGADDLSGRSVGP
jgi:hypothetical protein